MASPVRESLWFWMFLGTLAPLAAASPLLGQGGVYIDADGVLRQVDRAEGRRLARLRDRPNVEAATGAIGEASALRRVSLRQIQERLQALHDAGQPVPDELRFLGGLTRVQYVFVYPEQSDIVLAGPAEGWHTNRFGEVVGTETGQPVIHLDDLVVALRALRPGAGEAALGCSIDPTPEGLARLREYVSNLPAVKSLAQGKAVYRQMSEQLGRQLVRIFGVPEDTHCATVLVEADYRMKRISLGLEAPGVKDLPSTLELAARLGRTTGGNVLYRWWFVPHYDAVLVGDDRLAFELRGAALKLLSDSEFISRTGGRQSKGQSDPVSEGFATAFTDAIPELCEKRPIFAALRNITDLAVVAALIHQQGLAARAGWSPDWLLDPEHYQTESYPVAKQADSLANAQPFRRGNTRYLTGSTGGVTIRPADVLSADVVKRDEEGSVARQRKQSRQSSLASWWWD